MTRDRRRPKNLEEYKAIVDWYYYRFLLSDCAFRGVNPPLDMPISSITDFIRNEAWRIVYPFDRWERALNIINKVAVEQYKEPGFTGFDVTAGQYRFRVFRKKAKYGDGYTLHFRSDSKNRRCKKLLKSLRIPSHRSKLKKTPTDRAFSKLIERDIRLAYAMMACARSGSFPYDEHGDITLID